MDENYKILLVIVVYNLLIGIITFWVKKKKGSIPNLLLIALIYSFLSYINWAAMMLKIYNSDTLILGRWICWLFSYIIYKGYKKLNTPIEV